MIVRVFRSLAETGPRWCVFSFGAPRAVQLCLAEYVVLREPRLLVDQAERAAGRRSHAWVVGELVGAHGVEHRWPGFQAPGGMLPKKMPGLPQEVRYDPVEGVFSPAPTGAPWADLSDRLVVYLPP